MMHYAIKMSECPDIVESVPFLSIDSYINALIVEHTM